MHCCLGVPCFPPLQNGRPLACLLEQWRTPCCKISSSVQNFNLCAECHSIAGILKQSPSWHGH